MTLDRKPALNELTPAEIAGMDARVQSGSYAAG